LRESYEPGISSVQWRKESKSRDGTKERRNSST